LISLVAFLCSFSGYVDPVPSKQQGIKTELLFEPVQFTESSALETLDPACPIWDRRVKPYPTTGARYGDTESAGRENRRTVDREHTSPLGALASQTFFHSTPFLSFSFLFLYHNAVALVRLHVQNTCVPSFHETTRFLLFQTIPLFTGEDPIS
jgi:hypothetical protein